MSAVLPLVSSPAMESAAKMIDDRCASRAVIEPDDPRWIEFITHHPQANIFHHPAWMHALAECYGYRPFVVTLQDADGAIEAGLPVMDVNSWLTGQRWVSLPFSDYCRPLAADGERVRELTAGLADLASQASIPKVELRWGVSAHPEMRSECRFVLNTLALEPAFASVANRFERVHRQNIRTAEKNGIEVRQSADRGDIRRFYELQLETRRRKGVPAQPQRYFDLLGTELAPAGMASVMLAFKDSECIAGLFLLHWRDSVIFKYAASRQEALSLRPNNLLFRDAIRWGCENGYRLLDMGRTDLANQGLRRYKKGWGAIESELAYSEMGHGGTSPASGRLSRIMERTIVHSPPWVCRLAGELLYGHFG